MNKKGEKNMTIRPTSNNAGSLSEVVDATMGSPATNNRTQVAAVNTRVTKAVLPQVERSVSSGLSTRALAALEGRMLNTASNNQVPENRSVPAGAKRIRQIFPPLPQPRNNDEPRATRETSTPAKEASNVKVKGSGSRSLPEFKGPTIATHHATDIVSDDSLKAARKRFHDLPAEKQREIREAVSKCAELTDFTTSKRFNLLDEVILGQHKKANREEEVQAAVIRLDIEAAENELDLLEKNLTNTTIEKIIRSIDQKNVASKIIKTEKGVKEKSEILNNAYASVKNYMQKDHVLIFDKILKMTKFEGSDSEHAIAAAKQVAFGLLYVLFFGYLIDLVNYLVSTDSTMVKNEALLNEGVQRIVNEIKGLNEDLMKGVVSEHELESKSGALEKQLLKIKNRQAELLEKVISLNKKIKKEIDVEGQSVVRDNEWGNSSIVDDSSSDSMTDYELTESDGDYSSDGFDSESEVEEDMLSEISEWDKSSIDDGLDSSDNMTDYELTESDDDYSSDGFDSESEVEENKTFQRNKRPLNIENVKRRIAENPRTVRI